MIKGRFGNEPAFIFGNSLLDRSIDFHHKSIGRMYTCPLATTITAKFRTMGERFGLRIQKTAFLAANESVRN
jgi:hypothetical protein